MVSVVLASVLAAAGWPNVALTRVTTGFASPTQVTSAGDGSGRLFVVEQRGLVRIVKDGAVLPAPFLDIRDRVSCCGERGLLSIAFEPGRGPKTRFWANYTDLAGNTQVSRFSFSGDAAFASTEVKILSVGQPFANHNGGQLAFGPDGYLYVGMGDGGSGGDPLNNGQSLGTLLGKILRVDVLGGTVPYAIPPSNPFIGSSTARPEIWAYGLRNPWRFSFDRKTGDLFIGDVGQGAWEEVDFQAAGFAGGANYGWRVTEGAHCYNPPSGCVTTGMTPPVAEYSHANGCSITGGFVYRGRDFARLGGIYFYADYCSGRVWGLRRGATGWETAELLRPGYAFTSFGESDDGELLAVDGSSGTLYRLVDADGPLAILTVPVVVDVSGASGARFVSELTLGNRGASDATVSVTFTASDALGSRGSGTFTTTVAAGRQLVFADALQWLRQNGLFIPLGDQGGTLRLAYSGLVSGDAAFASVRTLAVLPEGRAGLAYPALAPNETLDAPVALYGLREDASFRSNVGLLNAGDPATGGSVSLRVTVRSGAAGDGRSVTLPDVTLGPGQWTQLNRVLAAVGYANGWVTVARVGGTDPFYAYGVVNDNVTGDGAFVAPVAAGRTATVLTLPVAVHTDVFTTELCLTNAGDVPVRLSFPGSTTGEDAVLQPQEQRFVSDVLPYLGFSAQAMALRVSSKSGAAAFHASARTASRAAAGGTFGVAYSALAVGEVAFSETWLFGLKQDGLTRSNLALANTNPPVTGSPPTPLPVELTLEFFNGETGLPAGSRTISVDSFSPTWIQVNAPLSPLGIRSGYARVRAPAGNSLQFFAYGIVNDGAVPGAGTGDGSYLGMAGLK
ncbi:MAG TPA: PQQ-dependent sugar dehydrogenase [Thermoanaerobaculia bacterium]|nr:PQQ-dependent sugar dehydrogenase [Thermoanaerobaculia bacterium]